MPRPKRSGQVVVVPEAQVMEPPPQTQDDGVEEGLWMGAMDALAGESWSVRPPARSEPTEKVDEFPLPPVWTAEWQEEWDDLLFPPYPDEVTDHDAAGNSGLGSSTTA